MSECVCERITCCIYTRVWVVGMRMIGTYLVVMRMRCTLRCDVALRCPLHGCVLLLRCSLRCSAVKAEQTSGGGDENYMHSLFI